MTNQGAFDSMLTWAQGEGCSASARVLTMTLESPADGEKFQTGEAHTPQNCRTFPRGVLNLRASPDEGSHRTAADDTNVIVVNAAPWIRRQKLQWQFTTGPRAPSIRYSSRPQ
jgi:hypothetical protein